MNACTLAGERTDSAASDPQYDRGQPLFASQSPFLENSLELFVSGRSSSNPTQGHFRKTRAQLPYCCMRHVFVVSQLLDLCILNCILLGPHGC